jgi:hypothetical protein
MNLPDFYQQLSSLLSNHPKWRPFMCNGDPTKSKALVIGVNPATLVHPLKKCACSHCGSDLQSRIEFLNYFCPKHGFDKQRWIEDYKETRRPAKRRMSTARSRINSLTDGMDACLETNIYAQITAKARDVTEKDTTAFSLILSAVRPRAMLVHGEAAAAVACKLGVDTLPQDGFKPISVPWGTVWVRAIPHLSARKGIWNRDKLQNLACEFRALMDDGAMSGSSRDKQVDSI